jgi:DNA-binding MarR family transcriptional regulator
MDYYDALWALERAPDQRLRMSELAAQMIASRSNVTRLIDRMENDGLVARERLEEDRRGACAVLTPEGKKLRKKMWAVYGPAIEELFDSQLTKAERTALASAMHKLIDVALRAG